MCYLRLGIVTLGWELLPELRICFHMFSKSQRIQRLGFSVFTFKVQNLNSCAPHQKIEIAFHSKFLLELDALKDIQSVVKFENFADFFKGVYHVQDNKMYIAIC